MENKIAAVTVLYYPDKNIVDNIKMYIDDVEILFVLDNSERINLKLKSEICKLSKKINYYSFGENLGIAKAFNIAAEEAIGLGYKWLLTMDQDSKMHNDTLRIMKEFINNKNTSSVGIVTPFHSTLKKTELKKISKKNQERLVVMSSGNILNLEILKKVNGFVDELFIDSVDIEYCLKLKQSGYKIIRCNNAILDHTLGDIINYTFLFFRISVTNHSSIRRYYITRNRLFVWKKYWRFNFYFVLHEAYNTLCEAVKIIIFEKNKMKKMKAIKEGVIDFFKGKFGKKKGLF